MREVAEVHGDLFGEHAARYGENVRVKIERCLAVSDEALEEGLRARESYRERCLEQLQGIDLLLTPTIQSWLSRRRERAGDPGCCDPLHVPVQRARLAGAGAAVRTGGKWPSGIRPARRSSGRRRARARRGRAARARRVSPGPTTARRGHHVQHVGRRALSVSARVTVPRARSQAQRTPRAGAARDQGFEHPALHRPPRLSWQNLICAREQAEIQVIERELILAPLTIELTPEVQAELDRADLAVRKRKDHCDGCWRLDSPLRSRRTSTGRTITRSPLQSSDAAPPRDQSSRAQRRTPTLATGRMRKSRTTADRPGRTSAFTAAG